MERRRGKDPLKRRRQQRLKRRRKERLKRRRKERLKRRRKEQPRGGTARKKEQLNANRLLEKSRKERARTLGRNGPVRNGTIEQICGSSD